ncbi:hypothetical protein G7Y89_g8023 [Cudoniella acicularis]|uniref:BTB domain-containing protein n=1 Tax=Cudoniella acicularis TaxID=354080 RepID=A0A8H4W390_9HELO|nr:hypothetical protein G7Y89_g8023 [Cudoniella acicularis]
MLQAQSVVDAITRCFDNDTYSDLTIKCRDRSWKVHRVIVCSQSKVLHAACVVDLNDDDPVPVEIMLKYFYTGKYNELINESKELRLQLQVQVLTYNLADKYDIPTLMGLAEKRFKSTFDGGPTQEEYLSVVSDVYTIPTPTNALRAIAVEYARIKFRDMMQSADLENLRATLQDRSTMQVSIVAFKAEIDESTAELLSIILYRFPDATYKATVSSSLLYSIKLFYSTIANSTNCRKTLNLRKTYSSTMLPDMQLGFLSHLAAVALLCAALLIPPSKLAHNKLALVFLPAICALHVYSWSVGLGFLAIAQLFWATELLLFRDPRENFQVIYRHQNLVSPSPPFRRKVNTDKLSQKREEGEKVNQKDLQSLIWKEPYPSNFWKRFSWVFKLHVSIRYIGWDIGDSSSYKPLIDTPLGGGRQARFRWLHFDPYFQVDTKIDAPFPLKLAAFLTGYGLGFLPSKLVRITVLVVQQYAVFTIIHRVFAVIHVSLGGLGLLEWVEGVLGEGVASAVKELANKSCESNAEGDRRTAEVIICVYD